MKKIIYNSKKDVYNLRIKDFEGTPYELTNIKEENSSFIAEFHPFKSKIINKYSYPVLNRIDGEVRHYEDPDKNLLPSVTTILSATESEEKKAGLQAWRNRIGNVEADFIVNEACNIGTIMHENLENYVDGKPFHSGTMPLRVLAREMAEVIIKESHHKVDSIFGQEVMLYYPGLWAGTTDLVGTFNGIPSIMDYKNSRQPIKRDSEKVLTFKLQGAAYSLAHEALFGEPINQAVFMCCIRKDPKNLKYQEFIFNGSEFEEAKRIWISRVEQYHKSKGTF